MVWAEMVMGRNSHGPKWLWAEMTRNLIFILSLNQVRLLPFCYISAKISILMYLLEYSSILTDAANEVGFIKKIVIVKTENEKRRFVMKVQAFCEEKGSRSFLGVFGYAESKNQCWQAEKWLLHHLICIFPKWPPKLRKTSIAAN